MTGCIPITYLTDCDDPDARARLRRRIHVILGSSPDIPEGFSGHGADLKMAATMINTLRAGTEAIGQTTERPATTSVTFLNLARRGTRDQWPNGVPFSYFYYGSELVITTLHDTILSFASRFLGTQKVRMVDIPTVLKAAQSYSGLTDNENAQIADTQFRSLWFAPLLARLLIDRRQVPTEEYWPTANPTLDRRIFQVDNFGNCVTALTLKDVGFKPGTQILVKSGAQGVSARPVTCYQQLTDVPLGDSALVLGSSSLDPTQTFVSLVVSGGSAAARFQLTVGDQIFE